MSQSDLNGQRQLVSSLVLGSHRRWPIRHEERLHALGLFPNAFPNHVGSGHPGTRYELNGPKFCLLLTVDGTFGL